MHLMGTSKRITAWLSLVMLIMTLEGCGLILDEPPPYPDQGVAAGELQMAGEPELDSNAEQLEAYGGVEPQLN